MTVDEMIIASINCLDEIEEHFKMQMIAWVRSAADFGEINDQLVKENAELKEKVSYLEDNLRVARKDRKDLQLEVGKGLKEFIKDCPYSALKLYANGYYVEQLTNAKEIIKKFSEFVNNEAEFDSEHPQEHTDLWNELCEKASEFESEFGLQGD